MRSDAVLTLPSAIAADVVRAVVCSARASIWARRSGWALKAGASGFLLKDAPPDQLVAAIRVVAAGDALLAPAVTRCLIEDFARRPTPPRDGPVELQELTAREREILVLIAGGRSNAEIGADLVIGESTVKHTSATC